MALNRITWVLAKLFFGNKKEFESFRFNINIRIRIEIEVVYAGGAEKKFSTDKIYRIRFSTSLFTSTLVLCCQTIEIDYIHILLIQLDKIPATQVAFSSAFLSYFLAHIYIPQNRRISRIYSLKQKHFGVGCE